MGIIKRFWYFVIKKQYRLCRLCKGKRCFTISGYPQWKHIEKGHSTDVKGEINVKCSACDGTGIIWDKDGVQE